MLKTIPQLIILLSFGIINISHFSCHLQCIFRLSLHSLNRKKCKMWSNWLKLCALSECLQGNRQKYSQVTLNVAVIRLHFFFFLSVYSEVRKRLPKVIKLVSECETAWILNNIRLFQGWSWFTATNQFRYHRRSETAITDTNILMSQRGWRNCATIPRTIFPYIRFGESAAAVACLPRIGDVFADHRVSVRIWKGEKCAVVELVPYG